MTSKDLKPKPWTKKECQKYGKKGGLVKSKAKSKANQIKGYRISKCKHCKVRLCPYKKYNLSINKEHICSIPEVKERSLQLDAPIMTPEILEKVSYEAIEKMIDICGDTKEIKMYHDMLLNHKKEFYPNVNKNLNLNVEVKDTAKEIIDEMFSDDDLK